MSFKFNKLAQLQEFVIWLLREDIPFTFDGWHYPFATVAVEAAGDEAKLTAQAMQCGAYQ